LGCSRCFFCRREASSALHGDGSPIKPFRVNWPGRTVPPRMMCGVGGARTGREARVCRANREEDPVEAPQARGGHSRGGGEKPGSAGPTGEAVRNPQGWRAPPARGSTEPTRGIEPSCAAIGREGKDNARRPGTSPLGRPGLVFAGDRAAIRPDGRLLGQQSCAGSGPETAKRYFRQGNRSSAGVRSRGRDILCQRRFHWRSVPEPD
jgi:hypothetical protein